MGREGGEKEEEYDVGALAKEQFVAHLKSPLVFPTSGSCYLGSHSAPAAMESLSKLLQGCDKNALVGVVKHLC